MSDAVDGRVWRVDRHDGGAVHEDSAFASAPHTLTAHQPQEKRTGLTQAVRVTTGERTERRWRTAATGRWRTSLYEQKDEKRNKKECCDANMR